MSDLVGLAEIAELAGVSRQAVANWRLRHSDFPQPVVELQSGPVFRRADAALWLRNKRGRQVAAVIDGRPDAPRSAAHRWWDGRSAEIYWMETTDREVLGRDLAAPQADDRGMEHHGYALVTEVQVGDVVFHYHTEERAIVGWSRATGSLWEEDIVWAAHGTVARDAGVVPYRRPGWRHGLEGPYFFETPITLDALRMAEPRIRGVRDGLLDEVGSPLYFPFALSDRRPLRPTQFYMTKFPADLTTLFDQLADTATLSTVAREVEAGETPPQTLGTEYVEVDEDVASTERDPFTVDPNVVDRGLQAHARVQNALAREVAARGLQPLAPLPTDPKFDLAWTAGSTVYVAEIKSLTPTNEEHQLRLGLGQVLRYRHLLQSRHASVVAVLAVEHEPTDGSWRTLCADHAVSLVTPHDWSAAGLGVDSRREGGRGGT